MFWKIFFYWPGSGSGSALTKYCGSAFDQCGTASLKNPKTLLVKLCFSLHFLPLDPDPDQRNQMNPDPNHCNKLWIRSALSDYFTFRHLFTSDLVKFIPPSPQAVCESLSFLPIVSNQGVYIMQNDAVEKMKIKLRFEGEKCHEKRVKRP